MQRGWVAIAIVVGLCGTAAAGEDPEGPPDLVKRALALAREGVAENDRGKVERAIELFKQGYELTAHPVVLCNAAQAYRFLGDLPRAHLMASECMRRLPAVQPEAVASFQPLLDGLEDELPERHVAVDVVSTPAGARVGASVFAPDERAIAPAILWLPEGAHTITASLAGHEDVTREVTITADDVAGHPRKSVKLELGAAPREVAEPAPPVVTAGSPRRTAGWVTLGIGAVVLAGGGVMHAVAYRTRDELAGLSGEPYQDKLDTFRTQRGITYGLYGVGAAAALTGAVLLYLSPRHGDRVTVVPGAGGDGASVWLDLSP